jgi:pyrroline-5-carboxylate reductase
MIEGPLWLIGCGNMGGAMLRGWLSDGLDPARVTVISPTGRSVPAGIRHLTAVPPDGETPALLLLAVKPQMLDAVAPGLAPILGGETVLLSILAGVEIASLRRRFPDVGGVVRVMPNTPVAVGKGVVALYGEGVGAGAADGIARLMAPLGLVEWLDSEDQFDAVTALSGSGPAFTFRFIDALAEGARALGIPADQALRFARATVEGSAALAMQSDEDPGTLADRVASPGGSTREGLNVLDEGHAFNDLLARTLAAATKRNAELAAAAR